MGDPPPQKIKVFIRKPKRPPPPPPGLPPGFRQVASAFVHPKKSYPPKPPVVICDTCYGFLVDYISVVASTNNLATGSQGQRIRQAAPQIAKEIALYFASLVPLDVYVIENTVKLRFGIQKESLPMRGPILLTAVVNYNSRGKDLLTQLRMVLEDSMCFLNTIEAEFWIGELLWDLWVHTITIHKEHSKQTDPTGCGPPFGFRVHMPASVSTPPNASDHQMIPTVSVAPPPAASLHQQQAWKPPEGSWKESDLYD